MYRLKKRNNHGLGFSAEKIVKTFFYLIPQPVAGWIAIFSLILLTAASIVGGAGTILNFAFPAGACAVGLLLYNRYPILYVGFVWWLWFLTPLVRRLADYTSGSFTNPSPILLSPYLVVFISIDTLWKHLPKSRREGTLPFVLIFSSLFYSLAIGLLRNPLQGAVIDFLDWGAPVLFCFYLFVNWRNYPRYRQNLQRVFFWGVLVMGVYGIIQYLILPEWERFWIIQQKIRGTPPPRNRWGRKAGESIPLDAVETHIFLGYT
ncbi:MAG: hypothetical protein GVY04_16000 [Cyanobacteria bacterium]|nr:hypothetical protein [Cyanobacteria bacterium GSL.Bin1]